MTALNRYLLDPSKALSYFIDNLSGTNTLSTVICKYTNFEKGEFYTLVREKVTIEQLYNFRWGGIGKSIDNEVRDMIFAELQSTPELICVFDAFNETYRPLYNEPTFLKVGVHNESEVYYVFLGKGYAKEIFDDCFQLSNVLWHSLCILSKTVFTFTNDRTITEPEFINFATTAQHILVSAYDGEGFVCWKLKE